jgi:hypothetical protein
VTLAMLLIPVLVGIAGTIASDAPWPLIAGALAENPTALHLRAMNMLYEGLKEKGALMLVPSTAVESMGMGGLLGAAALRQQALADTRGGDASKPA